MKRTRKVTEAERIAVLSRSLRGPHPGFQFTSGQKRAARTAVG